MKLYLPRDEELFPELFNGTASMGLKTAIEDGFVYSTDYDRVYHATEGGDMAKALKERVQTNLDLWLEDYTAENGVKMDAPSDAYEAFALKLESKETGDSGSRSHFTYADYETLKYKKKHDGMEGYDVYSISVADCFGESARVMLNRIPPLIDRYSGNKGFILWLIVPALFVIALIYNFTVSAADFMKSVMVLGLPVLGVLSIIAVYFFAYSLKDYIDGEQAWRSKYQNRKELRLGIGHMLVQAHRSIRYRRILLERMGKAEATELKRAEKKLKDCVRMYEKAVSDRTKRMIRNVVLAVIACMIVAFVLFVCLYG